MYSIYLHHLELAGVSQVTACRVIVEYLLANVDVRTKHESFLNVLQHLSTDQVKCSQLYTYIQQAHIQTYNRSQWQSSRKMPPPEHIQTQVYTHLCIHRQTTQKHNASSHMYKTGGEQKEQSVIIVFYISHKIRQHHCTGNEHE